MTSRERMLAALDGTSSDHVPLTTWCFGFPAPARLRWRTQGREVPYWYSKRLEHIHALPFPWDLEDEFQRALAWRSLGIDDVLEVSVPWAQDGDVRTSDRTIPTGGAGGDIRYPVMIRTYDTPSGHLRHGVRKTGNEPAGWPSLPDYVPLFDDLNIPRAVKHAVASPADIPILRHLYAAPGPEERRWFADRMSNMRAFADREGFLIQAWAGFGMDAVVWLMGAQGAVLMAVDAPDAFRRLVEHVAETDRARAELAAATNGVDLVCLRGWYSSTDFWSPGLFEAFVYPHVKEFAAVVHRHGKKCAYVMTTGVARLGPRLADAGVDLLFFVDPIQDGIRLETARELLGGRLTLVGGTSALSLASGPPERIRAEVRRALEVLGPTRRFILHPLDAIFPDTPWASVETLIESWKEFR